MRARLHNVRDTKKNVFLVLREQFATVQAVLTSSDTVSKNMFDYAKAIPKESIIDIKGTVTVA